MALGISTSYRSGGIFIKIEKHHLCVCNSFVALAEKLGTFDRDITSNE